MNISSKLTSFLTTATPPETAPITSDAGLPAISPAPLPASNTVDAFDAGVPLAVVLPSLPQLESSAPTISAATLTLQGAAALKVAAPMKRGPEVQQEPLSTETSPMKASKDFKPVKLKLAWLSQHVNHGSVTGGPKACNATSKLIMAEGGATPGSRDPEWNFNIAKSKDTKGRINPDLALASAGRSYIDSQLDAGKPTMVGVMWNTPSPGENGGNADHYVVITGRNTDAEGRQYYPFHDVGATQEAMGSDARPENRFYVDEKTGLLFRPAVNGQRYTSQARLEVSQIRKNQ